MFCTNCSNEVNEHAVACPRCGVPPRLENKFCPNCSQQLTNPNQVLCMSCGVPVGKNQTSTPSSLAHPGTKNKVVAGLLALLLGALGVHKFYNGSWGWGIVYILVTLTMFGAFLTVIVALVEGITYLVMDDSKYDQKYNQAPPHAFKW